MLNNIKISLHQQGSAIIVAMAIIAFTAVIAISLAVGTHRNIEALSQFKIKLQLEQYEHALLQKTINVLQTNAKNKNKDAQIIDTLPQQVVLDNIPSSVTAKATIIDAEGYFNINNLANKQWRKAFSRLQYLAEPNLEIHAAEINTVAIAKSIGNNDDPNRGFYLFPSQLITEKLLTKQAFLALNPYMIALPKQTKININALTPRLLASLADNLSLADATDFLKNNPHFDSMESFLSNEVISQANINRNTITTRSEYFLVNIIVADGKQKRFAQVLLDRPSVTSKQSGDIDVHILWLRGG